MPRRLIPPRGRTLEGPSLQKYLDIIREVVNGLAGEQGTEAPGAIPDFAFFNDSGGATETGHVYGFGSAAEKAISGSSPVHPRWIAAASVAEGQWCPYSLPGKAVKVRAESPSMAFTKGGAVWLSDSVAGTVTATQPTSGTYYWMGQARETTPDDNGFIWINPALEPEVRGFL